MSGCIAGRAWERAEQTAEADPQPADGTPASRPAISARRGPMPDCSAMQAWEWRPEGVHIWINNAGVDVLTGALPRPPALKTSWRRLWEVDVLASTVRLSRDIGARMKSAPEPDRERTRRAHHSSTLAGTRPSWGWKATAARCSAAIKGAVMAFTRSLARSRWRPRCESTASLPAGFAPPGASRPPTPGSSRAVRRVAAGPLGDGRRTSPTRRCFSSSSQGPLPQQASTLPVNGGFRHGSPPAPRVLTMTN